MQGFWRQTVAGAVMILGATGTAGAADLTNRGGMKDYGYRPAAVPSGNLVSAPRWRLRHPRCAGHGEPWHRRSRPTGIADTWSIGGGIGRYCRRACAPIVTARLPLRHRRPRPQHHPRRDVPRYASIRPRKHGAPRQSLLRFQSRQLVQSLHRRRSRHGLPPGQRGHDANRRHHRRSRRLARRRRADGGIHGRAPAIGSISMPDIVSSTSARPRPATPGTVSAMSPSARRWRTSTPTNSASACATTSAEATAKSRVKPRVHYRA